MLRETEPLAQGHAAQQWQNRNWNQVPLVLGPGFLALTPLAPPPQWPLGPCRASSQPLTLLCVPLVP